MDVLTVFSLVTGIRVVCSSNSTRAYAFQAHVSECVSAATHLHAAELPGNPYRVEFFHLCTHNCSGKDFVALPQQLKHKG